MSTLLDPGKAFSSFAVRDAAETRKFYGETLGLEVSDVEGMEEFGILNIGIPGGRDILVYPKEDHVPATYTILNFPVDDIERAVDQLTGRGVRFLRYDGFQQDEKGINREQGGPPIAWFTDPSGNVLAVLQERWR